MYKKICFLFLLSFANTLSMKPGSPDPLLSDESFACDTSYKRDLLVGLCHVDDGTVRPCVCFGPFVVWVQTTQKDGAPVERECRLSDVQKDTSDAVVAQKDKVHFGLFAAAASASCANDNVGPLSEAQIPGVRTRKCNIQEHVRRHHVKKDTLKNAQREVADLDGKAK
ncbi:hypothetical protein CVU75_03770 [Candidatus Dependentiae bacterium HGW-Dependentiae-1]|nr:MAG: hypothetical protein CVU75_03770 [Candidatus Dependentiae bacterium HGW-Dependentiae-1]